MTQPAIDQNTLLAEARQALEKLDRMKAERSRLDLEEKQLHRQLETEKKAAEDSVALTVKSGGKRLIPATIRRLQKDRNGLRRQDRSGRRPRTRECGTGLRKKRLPFTPITGN